MQSLLFWTAGKEWSNSVRTPVTSKPLTSVEVGSLVLGEGRGGEQGTQRMHPLSAVLRFLQIRFSP